MNFGRTSPLRPLRRTMEHKMSSDSLRHFIPSHLEFNFVGGAGNIYVAFSIPVVFTKQQRIYNCRGKNMPTADVIVQEQDWLTNGI